MASRLDFVKFSAEGAEARVLAGMRRLLHECRPILLVGFHNEAGWAGRAELLREHCHLYDMDGRRLKPTSERGYHALPIPE